MDGLDWLGLGTALAFVAVGALVFGARPLRSEPKAGSVRCSRCETPMSARRLPLYKSHFEFGAWMCPHCGARMDKSGKTVTEAAR
jgi:hypothetical protein